VNFSREPEIISLPIPTLYRRKPNKTKRFRVDSFLGSLEMPQHKKYMKSNDLNLFMAVLPDEFEPVSEWTKSLSLMTRRDRATRQEQRRGSA